MMWCSVVWSDLEREAGGGGGCVVIFRGTFAIGKDLCSDLLCYAPLRSKALLATLGDTSLPASSSLAGIGIGLRLPEMGVISQSRD